MAKKMDLATWNGSLAFRFTRLLVILLFKKNGCLEEQFLWRRWCCIWAKTHTATMLSRKSTKQDSLSIVLRTVEEHIPDSSREWSIVLPLRLERQWQKRKGHRRQFKLSRFVSMVTPQSEELPRFSKPDSVLTRCFYPCLNIDNTLEWQGLFILLMLASHIYTPITVFGWLDLQYTLCFCTLRPIDRSP